MNSEIGQLTLTYTQVPHQAAIGYLIRCLLLVRGGEGSVKCPTFLLHSCGPRHLLGRHLEGDPRHLEGDDLSTFQSLERDIPRN